MQQRGTATYARYSDNPGPADTHKIPQTFDVRPSDPADDQPPDELMIDWGGIPAGTVASLYWPIGPETRSRRRSPAAEPLGPQPDSGVTTWRYVVGSFTVDIPVKTAKTMLWPNTLAILRWRLGMMALDQIGREVRGTDRVPARRPARPALRAGSFR